jgi:hypothetical protein
MSLIDVVMPEIKANLGINNRNPEYQKIEDAASVLNIAYIRLASEEIKYFMRRSPQHRIDSKFNHLMRVYNKLIREHQIMFLLLNIFETALRSKAAILISDHFSTHQDDWWKNITLLDKNMLDPINKAVQQLHKSNINLSTVNTFDLFDTLTLGQLENIYKNNWGILQSLFEEKTYRSYTLPRITKQIFTDKIGFLRNARNDVAHHKPIDYSRRGKRDLIEDIELILRHLNFNLEDAINGIDSLHTIGSLRYA